MLRTCEERYRYEQPAPLTFGAVSEARDYSMELAGLEPAISWVRSNLEGKRVDAAGEESPLWSQLSLFADPANDGRS